MQSDDADGNDDDDEGLKQTDDKTFLILTEAKGQGRASTYHISLYTSLRAE